MTIRTYQAGGTLNLKRNFYIPRKADDQLLQLCLDGDYAYIFNASQTGKSSLLERTRLELDQRGIRAIYIDLTAFGTTADADEWYRNVAEVIAERLTLRTDVHEWWAARSFQTPTRRWIMFFDQVVLSEIEQPIVILIDEVDTTRGLPFRAEIYGALRSLRNARAQQPELGRLTFVLAGLAPPHELINDSTGTRHNIWRGVSLGDLTEKEKAIYELAEGLGMATAEKRKEALGWILSWTGGHPYLTQKLCALVQDQEWADCGGQDVEKLVAEEFLSSPNEDNLVYVQKELTKERDGTVSRMDILEEYGRVLRGKVHDKSTAVQTELKLTGVVKVDDDQLKVRNRIYEKVFDRQWLGRHYRPTLREGLLKWWAARRPTARQIVVATGVLLAFALMLTTSWALFQQKQANVNARIARSRELAAASQASGDFPNRRLLLAIEALKVTQRLGEPRVAEAELALRAALAVQNSIPLRVDSSISTLAISPKDHWLATGSADGTVQIWDLSDMNKQPIILSGPEVNINTLAFSVNERWLATRSDDGSARVWAMSELNDEPVILIGREHSITTLFFSPDGRWLATGSGNGTARLWDMSKPNAGPIVLEDYIATLTFSPDGHWLATGGDDGSARVWAMSELNDEPVILIGQEHSITTLFFSPDGRWLASRSNDGFAQVWNTSNLNAEPVILRGEEDSPSILMFSPDGRWLAARSDDGSAWLWNMSNLNDEPVILRGQEEYIETLAFSPDGRWLAIGGLTSTRVEATWLWDMNDLNADPIVLGRAVPRGQEDKITTLAFNSEGRWLATGSWKGIVQVWDMRTLNAEPIILRGHEDSITTLVFSPDGRWLVTGSSDNTAQVWDMNNLNVEPIILKGHENSVDTLAFSPDGRWLATGSWDHTARLWDLNNLNAAPIVLSGHKDSIIAMTFSPDGRWFATGSLDSTARLWDLKDLNAKPIILRGHDDTLATLTFSPDGRWLVSGGGLFDNAVQLWDMINPNAGPVELPGYEIGITALAFNPLDNGRWLVTITWDKTVRVWDMNDLNAHPVVLRGTYSEFSYLLAISPDGRWLAAASFDNTVQVWDMNDLNAKPVVLVGYKNFISKLTFSPDGRWLATGSIDGTVHVWDMRDLNAEPNLLSGHNYEIVALAFSPDGRRLVTASYDANARVWDTNLGRDSLVERACRLAGRNFTQTEWAQYFPNEPYRKTCEQWMARE